jgi:hypothetical protein
MATILWQLKRLSTNEPLNEPQELPSSWKNIAGLTSLVIRGETARLNNLSWAGHDDMGWFEIGPAPEVPLEEKMTKQIEGLLKESEQYVAIDNTSITKGERIAWMDYRQKLKELHLQQGFPEEIFWPARPE